MRYPADDCPDCTFLSPLDKYDVYYCSRENIMIYRDGPMDKYTTIPLRGLVRPTITIYDEEN